MPTLKSLGTREGHLASLCLVQACEILLLTMYWEKNNNVNPRAEIVVVVLIKSELAIQSNT